MLRRITAKVTHRTFAFWLTHWFIYLLNLHRNVGSAGKWLK